MANESRPSRAESAEAASPVGPARSRQGYEGLGQKTAAKTLQMIADDMAADAKAAEGK